jgi:3-methylfumaryl-CoA hydratase
MWAGSRIQYKSALPIGVHATRRSKILSVANKVGKRGALCFVTVEHVISCEGRDCIVEQQDIVYKEATPSDAPAPTPVRHEDKASWRQLVQPDTTLLFRFSALTFNGHRIHYDQAYARTGEGYPDLVVHGPLTAILLQGFALEQGEGKSLASFEFRGVNPLFVDRAFTLEGREDEAGKLTLWARGPDGELAMSATASFCK